MKSNAQYHSVKGKLVSLDEGGCYKIQQIIVKMHKKIVRKKLHKKKYCIFV